MNSDLRALPSPSTSSSSTTSGYSSGTPPKQLAWQRSGHGGAMQYGNGVFREPDRLENGEKIKRPMNAFMVWSQIRRAQIANQDGKMHNSQISKELGIEWRKMNAEQKAPFIQRAKDLRDELMRQHPDYVYRPKRKPRLRQKSPRALSAPAGHNIAPNNAIPTMGGGGPTVAQTGSQVQIQAQAQQAATTQMLLAAAAQQQQSLLLAAYQAQLAAVSSKTAEIGNDKISLASDRISDALLKSSQCAGSNGGLLAPPFGLLSYTGGMVQPTALTTASPLDTNRSFAAALASLNAHLNPLFLAQLSSSLMMANSLPNANSP